MRRCRVASWLAGGVVVLTACGSPSTTELAAQPAAPGTDAPAAATTELPAQPDDTAAPSPIPSDGTAASEPTTPAETPAESTPATASSETSEPLPESTTATTEPPVAEPAAVPALDAGCSVDNTVTDVADGPVPALDVRAESLANPLPDVAVRQINCAGGWVNLKNALPNDKPLLVWFWAPH